jgi:uncharacterized protein (TIGR02118 family)
MIKLIVLYNHPQDKAAFDTYYADVHAPLVRKLPHLSRFEYARVIGAPRGESPYYLIAELYWENADAMNADMASPEMGAVGKDVRNFAEGLATMHVAEVIE